MSRPARYDRKMPIVDCDVHPLARNGLRDILRCADSHWRRRLSIYDNWGVGRHPSPIGGSRNGAPANMAADAIPPAGGTPGSDPEFLASHLLDTHGIDACVLTPLEALYPGRSNNVPDAVHLVQAAND